MGNLEKAIALGFGVLLLVPLLLYFSGDLLPSGYIVRVLSSLFMLTALALAQNILLGYTGYPAFGAVAFFGIGGYCAAVFNKTIGLGLIPAVLLGGALATLLALSISPVVMRLKSHYFAITTLAIQLALGEMVANLEITGGTDGINLSIYRGFLEPYAFYLLFWFMMVLSFALNIYIDRSAFGYALKAIREDELAAESVGVNTLKFKSISLGISAFLTGLCGGIYAYWITYIDPTSMFDPLLSVKIFVALLLGGVGTAVGPVLGAFSLELVLEMVWSRFVELHGVVLGLLIMLGVMLLPKGIVRVR